MKVLWFNNIAIPKISEAIGAIAVPVGGWMVKLANEISSIDNIELTIAFPYKENVSGKVEKIGYEAFSIDTKKVSINVLNNQDIRIKEIIQNIRPDIIHIFGTEYGHSYIVTNVCKKLGIIDRVVISIQGLSSVYAKHFNAHMDHKVVVGKTVRDLYKGNVLNGKRVFADRGQLEIEALKNVKNIIGRTDWDKACTYFINPQARYYFNNEMLRDTFYYSEKWSIEKCQKHCIFMSQATLPLKGLHLSLEAISLLLPYYPDLRVEIAGKSYYEKDKWKLSFYEKFILDYIDTHKLRNIVQFTGFLDEKAMCKRYLSANVFVSASSIENSPNSVCEAMILGVPVVSSMVGGVANLLEHGKEGFYYQADAPYMLAYYVKQIFDNCDLAMEFSRNAIKKAETRHNVYDIINDLMDIYNTIY